LEVVIVDYMALGIALGGGFGSLMLWDGLKPYVDEAKKDLKDLYEASTYRRDIFGRWYEPRSSIASGWRYDQEKTVDPEDHWAVSNFAWYMQRQIFEEEEAKRKLKWEGILPPVNDDENIFSIGGPGSSVYSRPVGFDIAKDTETPKLPIYIIYNSKWYNDEFRKNPPKERVTRLYNGKPLDSGIWKVHVEDKYKNEIHTSEIDLDPKTGDLKPGVYAGTNLLEYDYLIITMMRDSKAEEKVHCIIAGMYGPGTMAFKFIMKNHNGILKEINEKRRGNKYFQSLLKIYIPRDNHEGRGWPVGFSKGSDIQLLGCVPIE
jgi:hypothetical protein